MRQAPTSLWVIMVITFFEAFAYFTFSYVLVLYLHEDLGYSDEKAGLYYGIFGVCISIFNVLLGHLVDTLRIKKTLMLANVIGFVARVLFALTYNEVVTSASLFLFMAAGMAIGSPIARTAIRRYTTVKAQSYAFRIFYVCMNIGAVLAAPCVDALRIYYPDEGIQGFSRYGFLIMITALIHLLNLMISMVAIKDVQVDEQWNQEPMDNMNRPKLSLRTIKALLTDKYFWRFVVFTASTIGVSSTYRYLDALYPTYMQRVSFAGNFPYMSLLAINPIIVVALTVPAELVLGKFHPYHVILVGAAISAVSPLGLVAMQYWGVVLFLIVLTVGEIIWSPQVNDYVCWLAPPGSEGLFFSLATVPLFAAKVITGALTGNLLPRFCPKEGTCDQGWIIWLIVTATTVTSPILLLLTMRFTKVSKPNLLYQKDEEDSFSGVELDQTEFSTDYLLNDENAIDDSTL